MREELFTAGELAKLTGTSKRTIRYYDSIGLLRPVSYSEGGYRYYDETSLEHLQKILMLKYLDFSLEQIQSILEEQNNLPFSFSEQKKLLQEKMIHIKLVTNAIDKMEQSPDKQWDMLIDIVRLTAANEQIQKHYVNSENLEKRIQLHDLFGTNPYPFQKWVFDQMDLQPDMEILEIGCGNGLLWARNVYRIPSGCHIILLDSSPGMIEAAQQMISAHLVELNKKKIIFEFIQMDASSIMIRNAVFDRVIANHMLYHVEDRDNLLLRCKSLLKRSGKFICSTVGQNHMRELQELIHRYNSEIPYGENYLTKRFNLENGYTQLTEVFSSVTRKDYPCDLIVDDACALYNYVVSMPESVPELFSDNKNDFIDFIQDEIDKTGAIYIHKSTGLYIGGIEKMTILVTGGAGYIGSHTVVELLHHGYEVVIVDSLYNSKRSVIQRIEELSGKKVTFYEMDILDAVALDEVFNKHKIDMCIHFAGLKAVGESCVQPLRYYQNNINGTTTLLETMKKHNCKNIIFSSSATVYGEAKTMPITEECQKGECTNPYGWTKHMIEQILTDLYHSDTTWNIVLLRYFNPIGAHKSGKIGEAPNGTPNNLMPYITQVAIGMRDQLGVFGNDYDTPDGTCVRDYIHVLDLASGHVKAIQKIEEKAGLSLYNLGTGKGYSVLDVIKNFESATGVKIPYEIKPRRAGDAAVCYADPAKAERELGWKAQYEIEEMCADSYRWQQNSLV